MKKYLPLLFLSACVPAHGYHARCVSATNSIVFEEDVRRVGVSEGGALQLYTYNDSWVTVTATCAVTPKGGQ